MGPRKLLHRKRLTAGGDASISVAPSPIITILQRRYDNNHNMLLAIPQAEA